MSEPDFNANMMSLHNQVDNTKHPAMNNVLQAEVTSHPSPHSCSTATHLRSPPSTRSGLLKLQPRAHPTPVSPSTNSSKLPLTKSMR